MITLFHKTKTRWRRTYPNIIGKRFFDAGEYGLGFFTVTKAWKCQEYCRNATAHNGTHWFDKSMIEIVTSTGIKYRIPYCPWVNVVDAETGELWSKYFDEKPW